VSLALDSLPALSPSQALEFVKGLNSFQLKELDRLLTEGLPTWMQQAGPQMEAYFSDADILFYGGSAGGGKSDLLLGLALTAHEKSIIFRREAVQLVGLEERMASILGSRKGYNSQDHLWRLPGDERVPRRTMEFGSVAKPGDWIKYQGRPHDLKGFDEICHFTESQFRTLIGWKRTDNPKVRQRVVCAGNPPTDAEGEWVIRYWAPWLDPLHPNPAKPGELRWYISDADGADKEVPGPGKYEVNGELVDATSRTFIPSSVDDNLFLVTTGYKATLQSLPEPLRSMMLKGDFQAGRSDNPWQLIPTAWVDAAMARWQPRTAKGVMTALGYDVARGGLDRSVAARRHSEWFDNFEGATAPGVAAQWRCGMRRRSGHRLLGAGLPGRHGRSHDRRGGQRRIHRQGQDRQPALSQSTRRNVLAPARGARSRVRRPHCAAAGQGTEGRTARPALQDRDDGHGGGHPDPRQGRDPRGPGPLSRQERRGGHDVRGHGGRTAVEPHSAGAGIPQPHPHS
jgi:hypothetical protein